MGPVKKRLDFVWDPDINKVQLFGSWNKKLHRNVPR